MFKGSHYEMQIETPTHVWKTHSTAMSERGKRVGMVIEPDLIHVMKRDHTHYDPYKK
jgi:spermidine/putrescine transport system ATP-binding protein